MGAVLETGRGSLPFALVHGEPLVACAVWALGAAEVTVVDFGTPWSALVAEELPLVLHDALCPLTPPAFVVACVERALDTGAVVVGVRPVTDTVKRLDGEHVGATLDRSTLLQVVSPLVLPVSVVAALDGLETTDLPALVTGLAQRFPVVTLEAPAEARRVDGPEDLRLLEALTAAGLPPPGPPGR